MSRFPSGPFEGGYTIRRRITDVPTDWTLLSFRQSDWFGACPQLTEAQKARAQVVGEVRRVAFRLVAGTSVATSEEQSPGDRYNSIDANNRVMDWRFTNAAAVSSLWWRGGDGTEDVEIEVAFDIPRDEDL